jgi:predicted dehydrogenase
MLNVAVIGYGYWGPNLARNWNLNKRANLKYICDLQDDRLNIAKLNYPHIEITKEYKTILEDPEIDAVNIVTPISTHYEIAKNSLLSNKHILVEKPLTVSSVQMKELMKLAEEKNKVMMVGHTFLYSPPVLKVHELIKKGKLGKLDFIQLTRINLGRVKHDHNVIWDLAPHDFSILEYWLGELPESIQVVGKASTLKNVCDIAFITLKYKNEILVNIHLSWISPVKLRQSYIVGKDKMVVYDDTHPTEKVKLYDMGVDVIKTPETFGEFQLTYRTGDINIPQLDNREPLGAECDHFVDCIESSSIPRTNSKHALRIIQMIEGAQESLKNNGEWINIV